MSVLVIYCHRIISIVRQWFFLSVVHLIMWRRSKRLERDYMTFTHWHCSTGEWSNWKSRSMCQVQMNEFKETKDLLKLITEFTLCGARSIMIKYIAFYFLNEHFTRTWCSNYWKIYPYLNHWGIACVSERKRVRASWLIKHLVVVLIEGCWILSFKYVAMLIDHQ